MARAAWLILKWLVIPVALACAGYYFVGPRINQFVPSGAADKPQDVSSQPTASVASTAPQDHQASYPPPDVSVTSSASHDGSTPIRHHRTHHVEKPKVTPPPVDQTTPPDRGSVGGTDGGDAGGGDTGGGGNTGGGGGDTGGGDGTGTGTGNGN